jgi:hypothetical protein
VWRAPEILEDALAELAAIFTQDAEASERIYVRSDGLEQTILALAEAGFVFNPRILSDAQVAYRRRGDIEIADDLARADTTPSSGPCAVTAY